MRYTSDEQIVFWFFKSSIILDRGQSSEAMDWVVSAAVEISVFLGFSRQLSGKKMKRFNLPVFQYPFFNIRSRVSRCEVLI